MKKNIFVYIHSDSVWRHSYSGKRTLAKVEIIISTLWLVSSFFIFKSGGSL